tara:strand:- start:216 stop:425 length:210 start_codon:yes stop_codon:yes gene_type:complete
MTEIKFKIKGTKCNNCKMLITDILEDMDVSIVSFDLDQSKKESKIIVQTELEQQKIKNEIENAGEYQVE